MPPEPAHGLVVRTHDWSETSRIVTFYTRELGRVRVLAKGGRRLRSNFEVALDLLSDCSIVLIRKNNGGLDLLTEARVEERFPGLRKDLKALYAGYYIAELLGDGTGDYDPHPALYESAILRLRELSERIEPPGWTATRFEWDWLSELGYRPRTESCAACGEVAFEGPQWISIQAGGLLCATCAGEHRDRRPIGPAVVNALRQLEAMGTVASTERSPATYRELRAILGQYVAMILGKRPKLSAYLA